MLGFDLLGITPAGPSPRYAAYRAWLAAGYAGEMAYLHRHDALKVDVRALLPSARSVILVGLNYRQAHIKHRRQDPSRGQIASYALGRDYHTLMRKALIRLDKALAARSGRTTRGRAFVDSAPVLERSWGEQAGLGFVGKNTCLIHPRLGSQFFIGGLLVPELLAYDLPPAALPSATPGAAPRWRFAGGDTGTCGRCRRCLDACPTRAFVDDYTLDARQCISYLTIEYKGSIPLPLREAMGNWIFGCDICQDVCPWNQRRPAATHPQLQAFRERLAPPLQDLLALSEEDFNKTFQGSALRRTGWQRLMRNICVAAGNWGDPVLAPLLTHHLHKSPPLVAEHAAWALGRLREGAGQAPLQAAQGRTLSPPVQEAIAQALYLSPR